MSKASRWADLISSNEPTPFSMPIFNRTIQAFVTTEIRCLIVSTSTKDEECGTIELGEAAAVALAHWILDTFED